MATQSRARAAWTNRIVGEASVDPTTLIPHPQNWRIHGALQSDAMAGILTEVGWIQRILVNQRTGRVVDGHLRLKLALDHKERSVPVLYVDLSEAEEALVLSTLDPISALAEADRGMLATLLHEVSSGEAAVQLLLSKLAQDEGIVPPAFAPASLDDQGRLDQKAPLICPECGHAWTP